MPVIATAPMLQQTIGNRYRVLREIGRGGMGVVYLVEHLGTGDRLALKLLLHHAGASPEIVERFKREARAPARIASEHVVRVTDTDVAPELGGAPYMVMELSNGHDLEKVLEARQRLSPHEVVSYLRQASIALDKAHALGITHRDLKPENLFLHRRESGEEILKILDFGISKMGDTNDIRAAALTKSGAMMGTPLYMSPEQARGRIAEIGPPTDVWAIGLIAYRLLTGRVYWTAGTLAELMVQIISEPLAPPSLHEPQLPRAFDEWFARSTDRDPMRRFPSVGGQVAALAASLGLAYRPPVSPDASSSLPAVPIAAPQRLPTQTTASGLASSSVRNPTGKRARVPLFVSLAAVLVVGGLGLTAWKMSGSEATTSPASAAPVETETPEPAPKKTIDAPEPAPEASKTPPSTTPSAPKAAAVPKTSKTKLEAPASASANAPKAPVAPLPSIAPPPPPPAAPPATEKKKYDPAAP